MVTNFSGQRPLAIFMTVHFTAELTVKFLTFIEPESLLP
jgi:hypothetical protein